MERELWLEHMEEELELSQVIRDLPAMSVPVPELVPVPKALDIAKDLLILNPKQRVWMSDTGTLILSLLRALSNAKTILTCGYAATRYSS